MAVSLLLASLVLTVLGAEAKVAWKMVRSAKWPTHFQSLHFVDGQSGWIVGNYGVIGHTSDGGATWLAQKSGTTHSLLSIYFVNPQKGWAVGENGVILHTRDGGVHWEAQRSGTKLPLKSVQFIDTLKGWAVGSEFLYTEDGGVTWQDDSQKLPEMKYRFQFVKTHFISAREGWLIDESGNTFRTQDGGASWKVQRETVVGDQFSDICFVNARTGWVIGGGYRTTRSRGNEIDHTSDGGVTWTRQKGPDWYLRIMRIHFVTERDGWAVGGEGEILHTADGGRTWSYQSSGVRHGLTDVHFLNATDGWAIGEHGTILQTTDGGYHWMISNVSDDKLDAVQFLDRQNGWAVGTKGTILHTADGGNTWTSQQSGTQKDLYGLHFMDAHIGWIVGHVILHTTDGGNTWTLQRRNSWANGVYFINAQEGWVVDRNQVLHTTDGGATWKPQAQLDGKENGDIDESYYLSGVYFANPKKGWIVGAHNIHDYTGRVLPPHLVTSKQVWLHTTDGGQTWQFMTEKEIDTVPHKPSLHGKVFANPLEGWEIRDGKIFHTVNGGLTWRPQVKETYHRVYGISAAGATDLWAVGEFSTIWKYADVLKPSLKPRLAR